MTLPVMPMDRQTLWAPLWVLKVGPFGESSGFGIGEGGAIGSDAIGAGVETFTAAYGTRETDAFPYAVEGRIVNGVQLSVQRSLSETRWGFIARQDVTVEIAGTLPDLRGVSVKLERVDLVSMDVATEFVGLVEEQTEQVGTTSLLLHNIAITTLEEKIPKRLITIAEFPLAVKEALGAVIPVPMGRPYGMPMPCVRDDQLNEQFDYLLGTGALGLTGAWRIDPQGGPSFQIEAAECQPPHGTIGTNLGMETWTGGPSVAPDGWTLTGTGAAIAKNTTAGHFSEGLASAQITKGLTDTFLTQNLATVDVNYPLAWWQGRTIFVEADVWSEIGSVCYIGMNDGVLPASVSDPHTGSSTFETLTLPVEISPTATQVTIYCVIVNRFAIIQVDNFRIRVGAKTWEEAARTDLYPGLTAIRTLVRQEQGGGTLFTITADVIGRLPERNAARAIRTILSDSTNMLGKAIDATSFDQAEIDAAYSYQDLVAPDNPQVLLEFDDRSLTARDSSGYGRDGVFNVIQGDPAGGITNPATNAGSLFDNGDYCLQNNALGSEVYVTVPYHPAFNPTSAGIEFDIWYNPKSFTFQYPIVEKLVGTATGTGQWLYQDPVDVATARIVFSVVTDLGTYSTFFEIGDVWGDPFQWMHLVANAGHGVMTLSRDGVLQRLNTYAGTLKSGVGDILIGKFGVGGAHRADGYYDKFSLYAAPSTPQRIAARALGRTFSPENPYNYAEGGPTTYDELVSFFRVTPDYYFRLGEPSGVTMENTLGLAGDGTYVGGPHLGVPGGLNPARGWTHVDTAVSFENTITKYGQVSSVTFSGTALTVMALYAPDLQSANSGILDSALGGFTNTSWLLFQEGGNIIFRVIDNAAAQQNALFSVTPEDVGRYLFIVATYDAGTMKLYRNGVLMMTTTYASPVTVGGGGDLFIGKLGSSIYPGQGDIDEVVIWSGTAITADEVMAFYIAGTWGPGGLMVDLALTEQAQAQVPLRELCSLRGMRLGVNTAGAYTLTVDTKARDRIQMVAREGTGDGERTIVKAGDRKHLKDSDMVKNLVVRYRPDLVKANTFLRTITRSVSPFGADLQVDLVSVREDVTADRVSYYMAERLKNDETVSVQLTQEARHLDEGDLVALTSSVLGYAGETTEVRSVNISLLGNEVELAAWNDAPYMYVPGAFASTIPESIGGGGGGGTGASFGPFTQSFPSAIAGATFNPKDFGAVGNGVANDTNAINATIQAATSAGGGVVLFPPGTYMAAQIVLDSNVILDGGAVAAVKLKQISATNSDFIISRNFATLTGTSGPTLVLPHWFGLRNITIDGNKVGNSSGRGIAWCGNGQLMLGVVAVQNCAGHNIYTECPSAYQISSPPISVDYVESRFEKVMSLLPGDRGWHFVGPTDSTIGDYLCVLDTTSGYGWYSETTGTASGVLDWAGMMHVFPFGASTPRLGFRFGAASFVDVLVADGVTCLIDTAADATIIRLVKMLLIGESGLDGLTVNAPNVSVGVVDGYFSGSGSATGITAIQWNGAFGSINRARIQGAAGASNIGLSNAGGSNMFSHVYIQDLTGAGSIGVVEGNQGATTLHAEIVNCKTGFSYTAGPGVITARCFVFTNAGQVSVSGSTPLATDRVDIRELGVKTAGTDVRVVSSNAVDMTVTTVQTITLAHTCLYTPGARNVQLSFTASVTDFAWDIFPMFVSADATNLTIKCKLRVASGTGGSKGDIMAAVRMGA